MLMKKSPQGLLDEYNMWKTIDEHVKEINNDRYDYNNLKRWEDINDPVHLPPLDCDDINNPMTQGMFINGIKYTPRQTQYINQCNRDIYSETSNYILVLDVEATGWYSVNFMTQFAFVLYDITRGVLVDYFSAYLPPQINRGWDPVCFEQFWRNNPKLYFNTIYYMSKQTDSIQVIMYKLINWIAKHACHKKIQIVSDNPSFDVNWINSYLPIPYSLFNILKPFQPIMDAKTWITGLCNLDPFDNHPSVIKDGFKKLHDDKRITTNEYEKRVRSLKEYKKEHCALSDALRLSETLYYFYKYSKSNKLNT